MGFFCVDIYSSKKMNNKYHIPKNIKDVKYVQKYVFLSLSIWNMNWLL
jgi:hypothetical protein